MRKPQHPHRLFMIVRRGWMSLFPKIESFDDLIGRKSNYDSIRTWADSWSRGIVPSSNPAIIIGEAGSGKTTLADLLVREVGLDAVFHNHDTELKHTFVNGRTPTFFGKKRAVILDDFQYTHAREWKIVEAEIKQQSFPIIVCVEHPKDVPWHIRRGALTLSLERPSEQMLEKYLSRNYPETDRERIREVARTSSSWRTAILTLLSSSGEHEIAQTPRYPTRVGNAEIEAIFTGKHPDQDFKNHPLALLSAAEYNRADPDVLMTANMLHSRSWEADDLTRIAKAYMTTLRTPTSDPTPFRKRQIFGSIRRG